MHEHKHHSPLDSFRQGLPRTSVETNNVCMGELANSEKLLLQIKDPTASILQAIDSASGLQLPVAPNTSVCGQVTILWLGPGKWLIVSSLPDSRVIRQKLAIALSGVPHLISDFSDARTGIEISGPQARTVLARVCALDLHPGSFRTGQCAQSMIARAPLLLHQVDDLPVFHLYIDRSLAAYAWAWLTDAVSEFIETTSEE